MSISLEEAIKNNHVDSVDKLLKEGFKHKFMTDEWWFQNRDTLPTDQKNVEILKLLLQYKLEVSQQLISHIFRLENSQSIKEFVLKFCENFQNEDPERLGIILIELLKSDCQGQLAAEILDILIEGGLLINAYVWDNVVDEERPLHLAIITHRMDIFSMLLERGASIRRRTALGLTSFYLAAQYLNFPALKLLLKNGVRINKRNYIGGTALHIAAQYDLSQPDQENILRFLLENGADMSIKDTWPHEVTPFTCGNVTQAKYIMVHQLAKLKFENHQICEDNLSYLQRYTELKRRFEECLSELQNIQNFKFYKGYSLYDIMKMSKRLKKLTPLMKNQELVQAFENSLNSGLVNYYKEDLKRIFVKAMKKREALRPEEEKLNSILKDYLPAVVVRKLASFANEHVFVDEYLRTRESDSETEYDPEEHPDWSDFEI